MQIVKLLKDYTKNSCEKELNKLFSQKLDTTLCFEEIKNKEFMIQYIKPLNDFIIYTTAMPCTNLNKNL